MSNNGVHLNRELSICALWTKYLLVNPGFRRYPVPLPCALSTSVSLVTSNSGARRGLSSRQDRVFSINESWQTVRMNRMNQ